MDKITSQRNIPKFSTLAEEARFWECHQFSIPLMEALYRNSTNRKTLCRICYSPEALARFRRWARYIDDARMEDLSKPYELAKVTTMMINWIEDRVREWEAVPGNLEMLK